MCGPMNGIQMILGPNMFCALISIGVCRISRRARKINRYLLHAFIQHKDSDGRRRTGHDLSRNRTRVVDEAAARAILRIYEHQDWHRPTHALCRGPCTPNALHPNSVQITRPKKTCGGPPEHPQMPRGKGVGRARGKEVHLTHRVH